MCEPDWIHKYIKAVRWQYAKTMPQCPHEYTIRNWTPDREEEFVQFVLFIRAEGYIEKWHSYNHSYYDIDGFKYWTMGDEVDNTTVLNRARIEKSEVDSPVVE